MNGQTYSSRQSYSYTFNSLENTPANRAIVETALRSFGSAKVHASFVGDCSVEIARYSVGSRGSDKHPSGCIAVDVYFRAEIDADTYRVLAGSNMPSLLNDGVRDAFLEAFRKLDDHFSAAGCRPVDV